MQEPKLIDSLKTVKCISVAAARDHTIIADDRYVQSLVLCTLYVVFSYSTELQIDHHFICIFW